MKLVRAVVLLALVPWVRAQSGAEIRKAANKALPVLERAAASFAAQRSCVSCHHSILPVLTLRLAKERGVSIDETALAAVEEKTFRALRGPSALDDAIQGANVNDPTPNDSLLLVAAQAAGIAPGLTTGVIANRLAKWQRSGHWVTSDFRPPHSSSVFTATATAVRAIQIYMPAELQAQKQSCIAAARRWLAAALPASTEDASFRLLGLGWAGAGAEEIAAARKDLLAMQQPSGGWPQTPNYPADAYSTGEALYALNRTGTAREEAAFRRGLRFLISTQAADGTWRVHTRMLSPADVSPKYFTTGFPYKKDEYLSYAGSSWAAMALLAALPSAGRTAPGAPAGNSPSWIRTALFGPADGLADVDANAKTPGGTTVLMMAAADPEKVRRLIARGADVNARSESGVDALTIACSYRGTVASVQALLDAGAQLKPPEGKRVRSSPLVFASMTGDMEIVKLLLAHGANPAAAASGNTPVSAAVTFGYPDVVEVLLAAGASAGMRERTGINLLHWATIANRPQMIPVLAKSGVPLNDADDFGFTPLMYAATIDFGDTAVLKALLKAGADRTIRNAQGRTALQQTHRLRLRDLEAALK
jgi:ankyrin repeat protein